MGYHERQVLAEHCFLEGGGGGEEWAITKKDILAQQYQLKNKILQGEPEEKVLFTIHWSCLLMLKNSCTRFCQPKVMHNLRVRKNISMPKNIAQPPHTSPQKLYIVMIRPLGLSKIWMFARLHRNSWGIIYMVNALWNVPTINNGRVSNIFFLF